MTKYLTVLLPLLSGCSTLPQLYEAAEAVATEDAIKICISRDAIRKDTDLDVVVEIKNAGK